MTKTPKKPDSRAKALAAMTKAELVKTIKALDRRQTQLLNEIDRLKRVLRAAEEPYTPAQPAPDDGYLPDDGRHRGAGVAGPAYTRFPWEQK